MNKSGELECDFEKNPTHLYLLVQQRDWDGVKYQAANFESEVKTFVYRRSADGLLKWRLLPLHAAVLNDAPVDILECLLNVYKHAAAVPDDHGMLPLHLAIKKHVEPESINVLLAAYPDSIDIANFNGVTPFQMAQTSSSVHKAYYQRALRRGTRTYSAVTESMRDLMCGVSLPTLSSDPRTGFGMMAT